MNLKTRLKEISGAALIALLLGASMSLTLLDAFAIPFSPAAAALCCVLTAVLCSAVLLGRIPALAAAACIGGGIAYLAVREVSILATLKETLIALLTMITGGEGSLSEHAMVIMIVVTVVFTLLSYILTRLSGGVYPALLLFVFVLMGAWFMEKRIIPLYAAMGLIALAVLYARACREGTGYMRALPAAVLAAVVALMLLLAGEPTWAPLENAAQKVRELFDDYFMFTDPRTVYSVSSDGYQPQGETLGGPANPRDAEIMTVKTDRMLFLRGSVRRTYTGYSWVDNAINSRYLFVDPTRQSLRDSVFDVDLNGALNGMYDTVSVSVEMLNEGTSTLFVPHRLTGLTMPIDLVAYYNDSGEVFITRGVQYGDSYQMTACLPDTSEEVLSGLTEAAAAGSDPDFQSMLDGYTTLPAGLEDGVYWLTQSVIEGAQTPYEKALAIQRHLLSGEYGYQLDVEYPPSGRDFVSYFLLDGKTGYCTYYASAMAVMARMAGLPSRYVEGYLVPAEPDGETLVTGDNAHAWVEIYFEGIGWVPFDPTPGENDRNGNSDNTPENDEPTPTPTPSPSPTPDRGDDGESEDTNSDETPAPSPTPTPDGGDSSESETPEPTSTPEPEPEDNANDDPEQNPDRTLRTVLLILMLLLLIAAVVLAIAYRWRKTDPARIAEKMEDDKQRLMVWYRAVLTLLMRAGFVPNGGETPERFARRIVEAGAAPEGLIELARAVERQQYACGPTDAETVDRAEELYERLMIQLAPRARVRWHMYRLRRGIGNFNQIP